MADADKPCAACPWIQPGRPDISPALRIIAEQGGWFCCHTRAGTCIGAQSVSKKAEKEAQ